MSTRESLSPTVSPIQSKAGNVSNSDIKLEGRLQSGLLLDDALIRESDPIDVDTPSEYLLQDNKYLASEPNPFEQSFNICRGSHPPDSPKPALPSVEEMFTPGGTNRYEQFHFESLRHGHLSAELLNAPQLPLSFDSATFRTGLTPNESNVRTGLTPGNTPTFPLLPTPGTAALLSAYAPNTTALTAMQSTSFPVPTFATMAPRPAEVFGENQAANELVFLAQNTQQQSIPSNTSTSEERVLRPATTSKANVYQDPTLVTNKQVDISSQPTKPKKGKAEDPKELVNSGKKIKSKSIDNDDEKRRNFLERNRQAALKCRQRKKQWLTNLQQKVEWYSRENERLGIEVSKLRDQVEALHTILSGHKECRVAQQNGATLDILAPNIGHTATFAVHGYHR